MMARLVDSEYIALCIKPYVFARRQGCDVHRLL